MSDVQFVAIRKKFGHGKKRLTIIPIPVDEKSCSTQFAQMLLSPFAEKKYDAMAPIRLGKFSVEIAVNSIDGFIHDLIDLPVENGFWVSFTVSDQRNGKTESFPLVDRNHRMLIYESYSEALHEAAQRLMKKDGVPKPKKT